MTVDESTDWIRRRPMWPDTGGDGRSHPLDLTALGGSRPPKAIADRIEPPMEIERPSPADATSGTPRSDVQGSD